VRTPIFGAFGSTMDTLPIAYDWILLLHADEVLSPE
jgi:hypothetical protein